MAAGIRQQLIVVAVAGIVLLTNLGGPRLWDDDEPRNAGCAAEMLARGDWVVPVFNGELRTHKPVLLYWLMMTAYELFGVTEFAARIWSALLSIGTVLLTYHLGRRLFDESAGLWSALALAPALMFGVAGRAATPDAALIFCSTLAIYLYVRFTFAGPAMESCRWFPPKWWQAALIYAAMGLGVLAKGPVGIVLPTAVIGMFLLVMRQTELTWLRMFSPLHFLRTCWAMRPLTALGVALAVALPWYLWVHWRTEGAFTAGFFLEHNFGRATSAMEGHRGNVLFYPLALAVGFFPWSVFLAPMAIEAWQEIRKRVAQTPAYVFALCWIGAYIALFSLAKTKLPSYITPCYPAVAILTGAFISRLITHRHHVKVIWLRVALGVTVLVGAGLMIGLRVVADSFLPGEGQLALIGMVPLAVGLWGALLVARCELLRMAQLFAGGAVAFSTLLFAVAAQRVDRHQHAPELLTAAQEHSAQPTLGYFRTLEPSWVFYGGQTLDSVALPDDTDPLESELTLINGKWQRLRKRTAAEFFSQPDRFVITTRHEWQALQQVVPPGVTVLREVPYFLKSKHQLVLIGRADAPLQAATPAAENLR